MANVVLKLFPRREQDRPIKGPRPLLLGVVGDSGTGKTTLVRGLQQLLGRNRLLEICLDDYHRHDRAERARLGLSALDPAANHLDLMVEHLGRLREGYRITKPVYDHSTGKFASPQVVNPRPVIVVHGLFTLFNRELADLFDLSLYLDPQESLRLEWKIARDTHKRGYKLEEVLAQIEERQPLAAAYIHPQKDRADLLISFRRPVSLLENTQLDVRLSPRSDWFWPTLPLVGPARRFPSLPGQPLEISGRIDRPTADKLAQSFLTNCSTPLLQRGQPAQWLDKLGYYNWGMSSQTEQRQSLPLALSQLLIAGRLLAPTTDAQNQGESRVA